MSIARVSVFRSRDEIRANAFILDRLVKAILSESQVSRETYNTVLPEFCLAWVDAYTTIYFHNNRRPKSSDCQKIAQAVKVLHQEGLWGKVWARVSAYNFHEMSTGTRPAKPWTGAVKYLKACRLLIMCLQMQGSQEFYSECTLAILTTAFRVTIMIRERMTTIGLCRAYERKLIKRLYHVWHQMFDWTFKAHWEPFTWVQILNIAQKLGKAMLPIVTALFRHIPSALHRSYGLIHLMERCLQIPNAAWDAELVVPARPTQLLTYGHWATAMSVASTLFSTFHVHQVPGRERPVTMVCGFTVEPCHPKLWFLTAWDLYSWDSRILKVVHTLGERLGLWELTCPTGAGFDVVEYEAQTRNVWGALARLPMNTVCFESALEMQKRWFSQQLAIRAGPPAPEPDVFRHPAEKYPSPEVVHRLVQQWQQERRRRLGGSGPSGASGASSPQATAARPSASARVAENEAKRELPRDEEGLPIPPVQVLDADHGIHMDDLESAELEKTLPHLAELANQFYDPVKLDLVQRCPVVVRLTNSDTSSRAYERDEIVKWVHAEMRRQRANPDLRSHTPIIKDPYGGGIIDLKHPRGWYCQPLHLWVAFNTVISTVKHRMESVQEEEPEPCAMDMLLAAAEAESQKLSSNQEDDQPRKRQRVAAAEAAEAAEAL